VSRAAAAAEQRRRILGATADLVAELGYSGTTIEMIVRRAKVGYTTFYKSYADKEECFAALLDAAHERTLRRVEEAYEGEGLWPDRVRAAVEALFAEVAAHPTVARACLLEAPAAGPKARARYEEALRSFTRFLRPGRELDPSLLALPDTVEDTLLGGVLWIVEQRLTAGEAATLPGLLPETLEFVLRPYLGEEQAARGAGGSARSLSR
jgi:AcrR family transcriptional regulator